MTKIIGSYRLVALIFFFVILTISGCGPREDKAASSAKPVMAPSPVASVMPEGSAIAASPVTPESPETAVEVDGVKLTKKQLDKETQDKLVPLKPQIPPANIGQATAEIRKGLIDEFVVRTLLTREITNRKLTATDKEIAEITDAMKAQLPAGVTMDEFLKKNGLDAKKMREEVGLNIRINKLVMHELGGKVSVTDQEIRDFYNKNLDKFKQPETIHARHLLVAKASEDSEKIKAEKKAKTEEFRKQLLAGADFAVLAAKNSDCPSKQNGGDLGFFPRGQMVKSFEDAAFSQEKNAIGPVVETDFGYHIVQVLEHRSAQVAKLEGETKKQIAAFLERQKQQGAFDGLVKKLKASANIVVYGK